MNTTLEADLVEVETDTILHCIYVQRNCTEEYFNDMLVCIRSLPNENNLLVVGDFNSPDINWESLCTTCPRSMKFCDYSISIN